MALAADLIKLTPKRDQKAYLKAYYQANKDKMKASAKANREADLEADRASQRARRAANVEVVRQRDRDRLAANRDAINARRRELAEQRRLAGVKRTFDAEQNRIYRSNRRALERNAPGRHTKLEIAAMLTAQNFECVYCKDDLTAEYHVDHIQALARGGSNDIGNIQILCPTCNRRKHARDAAEFAANAKPIRLSEADS